MGGSGRKVFAGAESDVGVIVGLLGSGLTAYSILLRMLVQKTLNCDMLYVC